MRDLDALLNSLVNIDRKSLVAVLSSEAEAARRSIISARQHTPSQRAKRHEAVERYARQLGSFGAVARGLLQRRLDRLFFQHGDVAPEMSERDVTLCKSLEERLRDRGHS